MKDIDTTAAERVQRDNFVDDIITEGTVKEVSRFKGTKDDNLKWVGTVPKIMATVGLKLKAISVSRKDNGRALENLGGSVLGLGFNTKEDLLYVKYKAHILPKKRNKLTGSDLTKDDLAGSRSQRLTKQLCLGLCSGQYDPCA